HSIGCVACHAPFEHADTLARPLWDFPEAFEPAAPRPTSTHTTDSPGEAKFTITAEFGSGDAARDPRELRGIANRTTRAALAAYLRDPLAVHPAGRMPSLALNAGEASDLAAYLF